MKRLTKTIFTIFLMTLLSACGGGGGGGGVGPSYTADFMAAVGGASPRVYLQENRVDGSTIYLDVVVEGVSNLHGAAIKIDYNATMVQWGGSHTAGSLLTGGMDYSNLDGGLEGSVVIGVTGTGEVAGNGVIVTVPFKVIATGDSAITIDAARSDLTDSSSPDPNILTVNSWDGGTISGI